MKINRFFWTPLFSRPVSQGILQSRFLKRLRFVLLQPRLWSCYMFCSFLSESWTSSHEHHSQGSPWPVLSCLYEVQQTISPHWILDCLRQEAAIKALPRPLGLFMHFYNIFPACIGVDQISHEMQGPWTWFFFQLCEEALIYFSMTHCPWGFELHRNSGPALIFLVSCIVFCIASF